MPRMMARLMLSAGILTALAASDGRAQARIHVGIAAAARGNHDFLDDAGENFAALGVEGGLLVLDRRPFGVTGHSKPLSVKVYWGFTPIFEDIRWGSGGQRIALLCACVNTILPIQ